MLLVIVWKPAVSTARMLEVFVSLCAVGFGVSCNAVGHDGVFHREGGTPAPEYGFISESINT